MLPRTTVAAALAASYMLIGKPRRSRADDDNLVLVYKAAALSPCAVLNAKALTVGNFANAVGIQTNADVKLCRALLGASRQDLLFAFRLIDADGNDNVDASELQEFLTNLSSEADVHQSSLVKNLFGKNKTLKFKQFNSFVEDLNQTVLMFEFDCFAQGKDYISIKDFLTAFTCSSLMFPKYQ
jgi:hypothetical protein